MCIFLRDPSCTLGCGKERRTGNGDTGPSPKPLSPLTHRENYCQSNIHASISIRISTKPTHPTHAVPGRSDARSLWQARKKSCGRDRQVKQIEEKTDMPPPHPPFTIHPSINPLCPYSSMPPQLNPHRLVLLLNGRLVGVALVLLSCVCFYIKPLTLNKCTTPHKIYYTQSTSTNKPPRRRSPPRARR